MSWERIADVNLNRLDESLKFIEDFIRFLLEDKTLLIQIRRIRGKYLDVRKNLSLFDIITFRESKSDLGRTAGFDMLSKRPPNDSIIASLTRAKESSRIMEEVTKSIYPKTSSKMKSIRFQIYDLEKSIIECLKRIFNPKIYAIIDERYLPMYRVNDMIEILEDNGATMIQLRMVRASDKKFYNYAMQVKKAKRKKEIKFIINNRIDIALACRADGVHLGQSDLSAKTARRILGRSYVIGISAHSTNEARKAAAEGADYIGVGSVYRTNTKSDARVCGLQLLKSICRKTTIPVVGIGGITDKNYKSVLKSGAAGIAVSSYLFEGNLKKNIRTLTRRK